MKIWLINHYAVPPQYYPLARQTYFAKNLMALGHEVTIFAASTVHNSNLNLIVDNTPYREDVVDGVHYVLIRCKGYQGNGVSRILNMLEFARKLPGVCDKYPRPDAIVATSMPPLSCAAGIKLARKYGCRGIAEIADLWPESLIAYGIAGPRNPAVLWLRRLEKWIYTKADAVVFTAEGAYDYIKEQHWEKEVPQSKVFYINNGVDLELFDYNKEHFRVEDEDLDDPDIFKVVYTGSIRQVNNLGLLLDAAKAVDYKTSHRLWMPDRTRPGKKYLTNESYLVFTLPIRRAQQEVDKKLSVSERDNKIDALTGQVVSTDKASSISAIEIQNLHVRGLDQTLAELVRVRGGDINAYGDFSRQLEENGEAKLSSLDPRTRARAATISKVLLEGMMIENNI